MKLKQIITAGCVGFLFLTACNSGPDKHQLAIDKVKKAEAAMHKSAELDPLLADSAVLAYTAFADQFKEDVLSPDFLFKSAEICTATGKYQQASIYYKRIRSNYPNYQLYVESCFLEASLLDNYMNLDADARNLYLKLIENFPDSPYANDAKMALQNLGKSDEQLIKEFKEKNHQ